LDTRGAELFLKNFVLQMRKNRKMQMEICVLYPNGIFKKEIKNRSITICDLGLKSKYDLRGIIKLISLINRVKYNIVHVHLFPANLFGSLASLFLPKNIKFIFSEHSVYNRRRLFKIFKILDAFIYSRYYKIICVSKQVQVALIEWLPKLKRKIMIISNAVPVPDLSN
jgi:hypothetical protein